MNKNKYHCPIINLDKLWTLVGEQVSSSMRCSKAWAACAAGN
jgi:large subunit ribosomal protein L27Ae